MYFLCVIQISLAKIWGMNGHLRNHVSWGDTISVRAKHLFKIVIIKSYQQSPFREVKQIKSLQHDFQNV